MTAKPPSLTIDVSTPATPQEEQHHAEKTPASIRGTAIRSQRPPTETEPSPVASKLAEVFRRCGDKISFGTFNNIVSSCSTSDGSKASIPPAHKLWDQMLKGDFRQVYATPQMVCQVLDSIGAVPGTMDASSPSPARELSKEQKTHNDPPVSHSPEPEAQVDEEHQQHATRHIQKPAVDVAESVQVSAPTEHGAEGGGAAVSMPNHPRHGDTMKKPRSRSAPHRPPMVFPKASLPPLDPSAPNLHGNRKLLTKEVLAVVSDLYSQHTGRLKKGIERHRPPEETYPFAPKITPASRRMVERRRSRSQDGAKENHEPFRDFTTAWDGKRKDSSTPSMIDSAVSRLTPRRRSPGGIRKCDASPRLDVGRGENMVFGRKPLRDTDMPPNDENDEVPLDPTVYTFKPKINPMRRSPRQTVEPGYYETVCRMRQNLTPERRRAKMKFEDILRNPEADVKVAASSRRLGYEDMLKLRRNLKEKRSLRTLKRTLEDDQVKMERRTSPQRTRSEVINFSLTENPISKTGSFTNGSFFKNASFTSVGTATSAGSEFKSSFVPSLLSGAHVTADPHDSFRKSPRRRYLDDVSEFNPDETCPKRFAERLVKAYGLDSKETERLEKHLRRLTDARLQQEFTHASMRVASPDTYSRRGEQMFSPNGRR